MSERSSLPVNRPPQIERLDNSARREFERAANQIRNLLIGNRAGAKGVLAMTETGSAATPIA